MSAREERCLRRRTLLTLSARLLHACSTAGGGDRGWKEDALKGLVAVIAAAHAAAGQVGSHISKAITAAQIEAHLFMSDKERVAATKKALLDAKDMAIAAAQAACAIVALATMIPQIAAPAASICAACNVAKEEL